MDTPLIVDVRTKKGVGGQNLYTNALRRGPPQTPGRLFGVYVFAFFPLKTRFLVYTKPLFLPVEAREFFRAENTFGVYFSLRIPAAQVMVRSVLSHGNPDVTVRNVWRKSGPKNLCLCFFLPDLTLSFKLVNHETRKHTHTHTHTHTHAHTHTHLGEAKPGGFQTRGVSHFFRERSRLRRGPFRDCSS